MKTNYADELTKATFDYTRNVLTGNAVFKHIEDEIAQEITEKIAPLTRYLIKLETLRAEWSNYYACECYWRNERNEATQELVKYKNSKWRREYLEFTKEMLERARLDKSKITREIQEVKKIIQEVM